MSESEKCELYKCGIIQSMLNKTNTNIPNSVHFITEYEEKFCNVNHGEGCEYKRVYREAMSALDDIEKQASEGRKNIESMHA